MELRFARIHANASAKQTLLRELLNNNNCIDSTMSQILLKGGTALMHGANDEVKAVKTNILVEGNKISKIGENISASQADIIDCTDKIISPGFIDTHHHGTYTDRS